MQSAIYFTLIRHKFVYLTQILHHVYSPLMSVFNQDSIFKTKKITKPSEID